MQLLLQIRFLKHTLSLQDPKPNLKKLLWKTLKFLGELTDVKTRNECNHWFPLG